MIILNKILNRIRMTKENFKSDIQFSLYFAILHIIDDYASRLHFASIANYAHKKKDNWIINYLETSLSDVIDKYKDTNDIGIFVDNAPIWICWWTGVDSAPTLVKQCIKSIYKNSNGHPINLITQDNYQEYLDIPNYIIEKVESKSICLANFSDYLRFALMNKYGGMWIDATIFLTKNLPESYFSYPIFSCKSDYIECRYISGFRWTSFYFSTWKNNILSSFFKDAFESYWKRNTSAIDYLFVDYIIHIAYKNNMKIKDLMDHIPINNIHRDDLQAAMNESLLADNFNSIIKDDTILYKLSWRECYQEQDLNGNDTVYKHFLSLDLRGNNYDT